MPVRVEPKVYFAAERTFLSWVGPPPLLLLPDAPHHIYSPASDHPIPQLEFSILLGTIAATLLNFGDHLSLASAWAFTALACLALLYSMALYLYRVDRIGNRRTARYHDRVGPTALCFGLLLAVAVSFAYRFADGEVEKGKERGLEVVAGGGHG